MTNKIYYLYINSKNRLLTEKVCDFNLYLKNQIIVGKNQGLNITTMSFSMINSMYNINSTNNKFFIDIILNYAGNPSNVVNIKLPYNIHFTIPEGNYNVYSLLKILQEAKGVSQNEDGTILEEYVDYYPFPLSNYVKISYNPAQNTFTFRKADVITFDETDPRNDLRLFSFNDPEFQYDYSITPLNFGQFLGLKEELRIPADRREVNGGYINMVKYQQVILKCPTLDFYDLTQDNINDKDNDLNLSQILFWVNKQDVEPFKSINYNNEDACTSYSFNVNNENISSLNFKLCNENDELIEDADDYLLQLRLSVYDKNENIYKEMGWKIVNLLDDIFYLLLNVFLKKI